MKKLISLLLVVSILVCAVAFASAEGTVSIYCAHPSDLAEDVFAAFTEDTGIKVEPVYGGGGELMARVEAEAANPQADIVWGINDAVVYAHTDKLDMYTIDSVEPALLGLETMEPSYSIAGTGCSLLVFVVNKDLLAEEDYPTSWADLTNEKYFGKISFTDPTASSSAYMQLCTMQQLYGWEFIEKFYQNLDGKLASSSTAAPKAAVDGEAAIGLTIENLAADYLASGANIAVIYPSDGSPITPIATAKVKNNPNPENAQAFLEYQFSTRACEIFVSYNRRPARSDVAPADGLCSFTDIAIMEYNNDAAADSETILEQWNEIVINN